MAAIERITGCRHNPRLLDPPFPIRKLTVPSGELLKYIGTDCSCAEANTAGDTAVALFFPKRFAPPTFPSPPLIG